MEHFSDSGVLFWTKGAISVRDLELGSLSAAISNQKEAHSGALLEHAVLGLDRWLRRQQGVQEYISDPLCIFRINRIPAERTLTLSDGTSIRAGDPLLNLHLWNEHILPMRRAGATVGWARHMTRALDASLRELACALGRHPEFDGIAALRADMCISTAEQSVKLVRIMAYYGFEAACHDPENAGTIHRLGETFFMFLLLWAINPIALRADVFRRDHALVYLSRAALERRYGGRENR
ncbi:MAG: YkoP family protein [Candidatus Binataceae bacterium]